MVIVVAIIEDEGFDACFSKGSGSVRALGEVA